MTRGVSIRFAVALAMQLLCMAALNLFGDWTLELMPIKFVGVAMCAGFAYLLAVSNFPPTAGRKIAVMFWTVAVALRLLVLALPPSDDLWRFVWDGKVQAAGANPYVVAPDDVTLAPVREGYDDWARIHNANEPSTFSPGAELLFRALSALSSSPLLWKVIFAVADLAVAGLLLLLVGDGERYGRAAWYAWNPLVAYSFAGAAHFDSVMLLALTSAFVFVVRNEERPSWRNALTASALFGFAVSLNVIAALVVLPFAFALRRRAAALLVSAAILLGLAAMFGWPHTPIWHFAADLRFTGRLNDLFWWVIEENFVANAHQRVFRYVIPLSIVVGLVSMACWRNWRRGMLWSFGVALLLMPVLHAWYCVWILPLASWRRSYAWHVLSVTIFAYYLFWNERLFRLPWHAEPWMRGIIIIPPLIAGAAAFGRRTRAAANQTTVA